MNLTHAGSPYTITATYSNTDGNFTPGTPGHTNPFIVAADTTMTTISGATSVVFNQTVTYTATVAATGVGAPGAPVDGSVDFSIDGGAVANKLVTNGVAKDVVTWANGPTTPGVLQAGHTVDATFKGDDTLGDFGSSMATQYSVTEHQDTTSTTISGATTVAFNQTVTYTATIAATGLGAPGFPVNGHVFFKIDGGAVVSKPVTNGVATDVVTWGNTAGTLQAAHTVDATFHGDDTAGDYKSSSATTYNVTENQDTTLTAISGPTSVVFNQQVTYTATIAATGAGAPGRRPAAPWTSSSTALTKVPATFLPAASPRTCTPGATMGTVGRPSRPVTR